LPPGKGELVLVVDDEPQIREMITAMLTRSGYRTIVAADGAAAAVLFSQRATEIRLVITDLHMPHLDGGMLARILRRVNPAAKVLAVSGMPSSLGDRVTFKPEEFADGFLHKPFKPETLLAKVHELLKAPAAPAP
jgi:DNA-binding response OmpR family regulator